MESIYMNKVVLVGGIPSPIGGVTSYIYRLVTLFPELFFEIWDMYPHAEKKKITDVVFRQFNGFFDIIFLVEMMRSKNITFHFNFSTSVSLIFLLFVKKRASVDWIVTLHNGDLKIPKGPKWLNEYLISKAIKKIDRIVFLSKLQEKFYLSYNEASKKLIKMDSFIPVSLDKLGNECPRSFIEFKNKNIGNKFILMNGYCKDFYRFEDGINFVLESDNAAIVIVLYGDTDKAYLSFIQKLALGSSKVLFLHSLEHDSFIHLLSAIDIYLRANSVDSYGIAVADAVCLKKLAVASNVCSRFDGAILFEVGNIRDMQKKLSESLSLNESVSFCFDFKLYCQALKLKYVSLYE